MRDYSNNRGLHVATSSYNFTKNLSAYSTKRELSDNAHNTLVILEKRRAEKTLKNSNYAKVEKRLMKG